MKQTVLVLTLLLLVQTVHPRSDEKWSKDQDWLAFVSEHQELYDEIYPLAKRLRRDSATIAQARKLQKIMNDRPREEQEVLTRMLQHIKGITRFDDPSHDEYTGPRDIYINFHGESLSGERGRDLSMEEVRVIGRMFDQFPMDPAEFSYQDILGMRGIRANANQLYSEGKYDEAYPLLLDLAKRGFKDSQSRLAYILFTGTESVEKSNLRALGWLGTAAHGESEPIFRVLFKKYMREVPESVRPIVDEVLIGYREQYDSSAYMDCTTNHRFNSGVVKRTYCQFDLEAQVEACGGLDCAVRRKNARDDDVALSN